MGDAMIAKFRCVSVKNYGHMAEVELTAVCDDGTDENKRFNKYTPVGELKMSIDREGAMDFLQPGQEYYLTFTPAEGDANV